MRSLKNSVNKKLHIPALIAALSLLLILSAIGSLFCGAASISLTELFSGKPLSDNSTLRIVLYLRLPRITAACLAGSALAVSGAILQCVLNNSLASPNIIGVNSGSGLTMLLFSAIFPQLFAFFPAAAFIGGFLTALLVYLIAKLTGTSRTTLILSGVTVNSIISSFSSIIKTLHPDVIAAYTDFTVGSISNVTLAKLPIPAAIIIACLIISMLLSREMNILLLGDEIAASLGMHVGACRLVLIALSAALSGAAVSFAGQVNFVGLLIPHIARSITGSDNKYVIPVSALLGAVFVLICDSAAKIIFAPFELPVGIILSIIGGIFFVYLLIAHKGGKLHD